MALSSLLAACHGGAPVSDRELGGLSGAPAVVEVRTLEFVAPSPRIADLLEAPGTWEPGQEEIDAILVPSRVEVDAEGWIRLFSTGWVGDEGWRMYMRFDGPEGRPPTRMSLDVHPPEGLEAPVFPMGSGKIRYSGNERVLRYSGTRPGEEGADSMERKVVVDADGRQQLETSTSTAPDGTATEFRREALSRGADGLVVESRELRDGVDYRVSTRYFDPDRHGNPQRMVSFHRLLDDAPDGPVQRAELILRTFEYHHETGR